MLAGISVPAVNRLALYEWTSHAVFLVILAAASTSMMKKAAEKVSQKFPMPAGQAILFWLKSTWCMLILVCSMAMLVSGSYNPFLYFRF